MPREANIIHRNHQEERMLRSIGSLLFFFGAVSAALYYFEYNLVVMMWVDNWGSTVGWAIRIGAVVVGGILWLIGGSSQAEEEAA
jgi:hypothetical protein